jgi:hypothetical protein
MTFVLLLRSGRTIGFPSSVQQDRTKAAFANALHFASPCGSFVRSEDNNGSVRRN